jgi:hypothetical protein
MKINTGMTVCNEAEKDCKQTSFCARTARRRIPAMEVNMKLNPKLNHEPYAFVDATDNAVIGSVMNHVVCIFRETEGVTAVISKEAADVLEIPVEFTAAWITLEAETDLTDVGITAAFSKALGARGISCNVFAPIHHDHIFVPWENRKEAMELLEEL